VRVLLSAPKRRRPQPEGRLLSNHGQSGSRHKHRGAWEVIRGGPVVVCVVVVVGGEGVSQKPEGVVHSAGTDIMVWHPGQLQKSDAASPTPKTGRAAWDCAKGCAELGVA
jgi:hypothetical protein